MVLAVHLAATGALRKPSIWTIHAQTASPLAGEVTNLARTSGRVDLPGYLGTVDATHAQGSPSHWVDFKGFVPPRFWGIRDHIRTTEDPEVNCVMQVDF